MGTMYKSTTVEFTRERAISCSRSSSRSIEKLCFICHNHQAIYYGKEGFWYCHSFSSRNCHDYHFFVVVGIGFTFLVSLNRLISRELPIIINLHDGRIRKHRDLSDNSHLQKIFTFIIISITILHILIIITIFIIDLILITITIIIISIVIIVIIIIVTFIIIIIIIIIVKVIVIGNTKE